MKMFFGSVAILMGLSLFASASEARTGSPLWSCTLSAELEDDSIALILGWVDKSGMAIVRCTSAGDLVSKRQRFVKEVYVEIEGPAVGLDLNFIKASRVFMVTGSIGCRDWRELLGEHTLGIYGRVNALFLEGGAGIAVEFSRRRLRSLQGSGEISKAHGLGATLSVQKMRVYDLPQRN